MIIWLQRRTTPLSVSSISGSSSTPSTSSSSPEVRLLHHGTGLAVALAHVLEDVVPQAHQELVARREVHRLDGVEAGEVVGVLDRHANGRALPSEGGADVLLEEVGGDATLEVLGHEGAVGHPEAAVEELGHGGEDLLRGDAELLLEHLRDVDLVDPGRGDDLLHVLLGDEPLVHEAAELRGLVGPGRAVLVVERDPEDLRELLRRLLVGAREAAPAPLVDELEDAQEVLVEEDGGREHLGGAEARGLVPARVEAEARVEAGERGRVVGVLDVHGPARERREPGDGGEGLGDPDLLDLLAGLEEREELLVLRVEGEDRHPLGVHEVEHAVLEVDEDLRDARRGVDDVGDLDEALAVRELTMGCVGDGHSDRLPPGPDRAPRAVEDKGAPGGNQMRPFVYASAVPTWWTESERTRSPDATGVGGSRRVA
jgi:hypothetical protein